MSRSLVIAAIALIGCHAEQPVGTDPAPPEARAEPRPAPVTPEPVPGPIAEPDVPALDLREGPDCASPREAVLRQTAAGDGTCALVEHLDAEGCVAVRTRTTVEGRLTREVVEVPGAAHWMPQPPSYVDLTPQPQITEVEHDAAGREVALRVDEGADGHLEVERTWRWTPSGKPLEQVQTAHGETWRSTWRYDARGREVLRTTEGHTPSRVEQDWDRADRLVERRMLHDGVLVRREVWTFDADGRLARQGWTGPDRSEETRFEHDGAGREIERIWTRTDHGRAVIIERHQTTWQADGGRSVTYTRDDRVDGVIDARRRTDFDAAGREVLVAHADPRTGHVTWQRAHRWDAAGRMTWWRNTEGGVVRLERAWRYDGADLVESSEFPAGGQAITRRQTWTRTADAVVHRVFDDAVLMAVTTQHLDAAGEVVEAITERGGQVVRHARTERTPDGRVTRIDQDDDGDGVFEYSRVVVEDVHGEPTWTRSDVDGDGVAEHWQRTLRDDAGRVVFDARPAPLSAAPYRLIADFDCVP